MRVSRNSFELILLAGAVVVGYCASRPGFSVFDFRPNLILIAALFLAANIKRFWIFAIAIGLLFAAAFQAMFFLWPTAIFLAICLLIFPGLRFLPGVAEVNIVIISFSITLAVFFVFQTAFAPGGWRLFIFEILSTSLIAIGLRLFTDPMIGRFVRVAIGR